MQRSRVGRTAAVATVTVAIIGAAAVGLAQRPAFERKIVRQADLRFVPKPNGTYQAAVAGDAEKPMTYAAYTRIPAGLRIPPHSHPEDRIVLITSGTLSVGFGDHFDETKMTPLPAGSVFTEPGGARHFTWAKDGDVMLYITGTGPTGTTWVDQKK